ncbi:MAG: S8 family serine peptidase [Anaerolineae bacterium]|nr:S8 family serine peptidase [Anaerolineae bacterium]
MKLKVTVTAVLAVLLCSLILMLPGSIVAASEEEPPTLDTLSAAQVSKSYTHPDVVAALESGQTVRLILQLAVPEFSGTAGLEGAAELEAMSKIDNAQAEFAAQFGSGLTEDWVAFEYVPYVSVWVENTAEYAALLASDLVLSAQQDIPVRADELEWSEEPAPSAMAEAIPWIDADEAHTLGYDGDGAVVAILDTGVDKDHLYLDNGKVVAEACFSTTYAGDGATSLCPGSVSSSTATGSAEPYVSGVCGTNECDHGTHVAGIVAGTHTGFSGVAPHADLIAVQVFSSFINPTYCGSSAPCSLTYNTDQLRALEHIYSIRSSYDLISINMSLGGGKYTAPCNSDSRAAIIGNLRTAGIATVIATGNAYYVDGVGGPSCISDAVAVGATYDNSDNVAPFSNAAPDMVDVWAPGVSITSSVPTESYGGTAPTDTWNGTSMATPMVAGAFAALKEAYPFLNSDGILSLIRNYGVSVTDNRTGGTTVAPRLDFTDIFAPMSVSTLDRASLRSPGADAIVYGGRPTFKWYPVYGATTYDIEMYDTGGTLMDSWTKGIGSCTGTYCEYRIDTDLQSNFGTYSWRVRARNTITSVSGAWSVTRYFTYTQLARTWQISPVDDYVSSSSTPTLEWGDITGATMYLMQFRLPDDTFVRNTLVSDADFCDGSTCTWSVDPGLPDGDYKWHVRAKNGRNFGRWTAYRDFSISGGAVTTFDFNSEAPNWVDPPNLWSIQNGATYSGTPSSACIWGCAATYYGINYTDAIFETSIRSTGTYGADGYSIYYRTDFDTDGSFGTGYEIDFYQDGGDIVAELYGFVAGSGWFVEDWTIASKNISDYHTIKFVVEGTSAYFYMDDVQFGGVTGMDAAVDSGRFGVDVISAHTSGHVVDMDWAEITDSVLLPGIPAVDPALVIDLATVELVPAK